ncbi:glycosyltransferase family 4 protein [Pelagicoccus sp. SDUM812003]|uniref:glycosyltransferase family 4 protein n=1 Tax=Pelagicoccus sp. SDUM812003 TaxID=3041267 RepID=UPI00280DB4FE|nr:glycosyltransferase family 4 protein [Pelagicoccus sp. SDUM812003]MDQ8203606.1 glycosyltransferase family 4 protein [Pelagicoccus sp. SDUM812003]
MRFSFVHFTLPDEAESGIVRYGRHLAAQASLEEEVTEIALTLGKQSGRFDVGQVEGDLGRMVFQFSPYYHPQACIEAMRALVRKTSGDPAKHLIIVHDSNRLASPFNQFTRFRRLLQLKLWSRAIQIKRVGDQLKRFLRDALPTKFALSAFDQKQTVELSARLAYDCVSVPHFVEEPNFSFDNEDAKKSLGLEGKQVLTILGFLSPHKRHRLSLQALSHLPENYHLVLAGGATDLSGSYFRSIEESIEEMGLADRVTITGYLQERDQACYIGATDLAICLYRGGAASGSLSTWIAHRKPILVSQVQELSLYNETAPGALEVLTSDDPISLAGRIQSILEGPIDDELSALAQLKTELSLERTWETYRKCLVESEEGFSRLVPMA